MNVISLAEERARRDLAKREADETVDADAGLREAYAWLAKVGGYDELEELKPALHDRCDVETRAELHVCDDCGRTVRERWWFGSFRVCRTDAVSRLRARRHAETRPVGGDEEWVPRLPPPFLMSCPVESFHDPHGNGASCCWSCGARLVKREAVAS